MMLDVDPGVGECAVAAFNPGLFVVYFTTPENLAKWSYDFSAVKRLVIEWPRIDDQTRGKDPNDIVDLAGAAKELAGVIRGRGGPRAEWVERSKWKGSEKKPIHHQRIWNALWPSEREAFATDVGLSVEAIAKKINDACERYALTGKVTGYSWKAHNLLDAVGLGLWSLGRVGRAGAAR